MSQYWKMWNLSSKVDQSYEKVVRTSRCRARESLADLTLQVQLWNTKWQQASGLHFYSLWYNPSGDQNHNLLEPARTTADTPLLDHWHDDSLMSNCHCVLALSICLPACRPQLVWIPPHILRGAADVRVSLTAVNQCNRQGPLPLPLPYTHTQKPHHTPCAHSRGRLNICLSAHPPWSVVSSERQWHHCELLKGNTCLCK